MKGLVVSGGGAKGAYGGGLIEYLTKIKGNQYDKFIGSSTGVLLCSLAACDEIELLKYAYTNIENEDIWKINPFYFNKSKNRVNYFNIFRNMLPKITVVDVEKFPYFKLKYIKGNKSLGDGSNLMDTILSYFTEDLFNKVKYELKKEIIVCVVNLSLGKVEYKSSNNYDYMEFCEWMFASASAYPFMNFVTKNGFEYIDGGTLEPIPIQEIINRGCNDVDVIVLHEKNPQFEPIKTKNIFNGMINTINIIHNEIRKSDIVIGKLKAINKKVNINLYYTPTELTDNSLIFNRKKMGLWWNMGLNYGQENKPQNIKL